MADTTNRRFKCPKHWMILGIAALCGLAACDDSGAQQMDVIRSSQARMDSEPPRAPRKTPMQAMSECGMADRRFSDAWYCTYRTLEAQTPSRYQDLLQTFLFEGGLISTQVDAGVMTETQAREAIRKANREYVSEAVRRTDTAPTVIVQSTAPAPMPMPMPVFQTPVFQSPPPATMQTITMPSGRMVNCNTIGTMTNCW